MDKERAKKILSQVEIMGIKSKKDTNINLMLVNKAIKELIK